MTRVKAASTHLLLSVSIFCAIFLILIFLWYPAPYFTASGGWQGLKIAASVDLVLGPILTFIIFDVKKPAQKIVSDLALIAVIQFTALIWGVYTIFEQRPLAAVFWDNGFYSVPAEALKSQNISVENLQQFGHQAPVLIYAEKPKTLGGLRAMIEVMDTNYIAPHHQVNLYRPLNEYFSEIKSLQVNIEEIIDINDKIKADLDEILANTEKNIDDYLYFSLHSKYYNIILLFNTDGQLQDYITVPLRD